jgi:hypothetical protein
MKIPFALTPLLALLFVLAPLARTHAQDAPPAPGASFDLFYNNLADDGDWYNTPEYGYVWQPSIAVQNNTWRPYTDGYWAQTDDGWTWVSYESFGWATYHYGRWTRLNDLGWAWVPGYDWGPGWVSWRTSNDYVGWAPLPPQVENQGGAPGESVTVDYNNVENVSEGYTPAVDAQFDIGPQNFCFVTVANFGAPVLSQVLLPPQQNIVIIQNTTNVTNIYYDQRGGQTVVLDRGGPDFNFISTRVSHPIQRLQLQPNTDPNYLRGNHPAGFNPTQVHNGVLQVAAPAIARTPMNLQQIKPPRVKATLAKATVIHGWSGAAGDPKAVAQAREKIKQQAQAVPKRQPNGNIPLAKNPGAKAPAAEPREAAATPAPARPAGTPRQTQADAQRQARSEQHPNGGTPAPEAVKPPERAPASNAAADAARKAPARDEERAAQPKATPHEEARIPERAPATSDEARTPERAPAAREEARTPERAPATSEEARTPARAPAAREEARTPEKAPAPREQAQEKSPAPREQERAPEKAATPREEAHPAKPEATHREEAQDKNTDDDKKKKKDQPQQ